jgi:hypothetical protein
MTRVCSALLLLAAATTPARAHFIWILPGDGNAVRVVFSDGLKPDDPALLKKIAHLQLFCRGNAAAEALVVRTGKDALEASLPDGGAHPVAAVCRYGVLQRSGSEPFLLNYYAKGCLKLDPAGAAKGLPEQLTRPWDRLPLEIVPLPGEALCLRVLWQGKPLAGAEYAVLGLAEGKPAEGKSDADGRIALTGAHKPGLYGIRVKHTEARDGELQGKAYKEVRHYTTLTLALGGEGNGKSAAAAEASRLLADARAARALYANFPGFTADVEVNIDGKVTRGQLAVNPKGKVQLELAAGGEEVQRWAKGVLSSIVAHRLDGGGGEETPCAFLDEDADNPLGRAIRVVSDEFHSSYRIRDRQILVVNRQMKDSRFTITMLENRVNEEKKFLPVSYVVNTWDLKTGALKSSEGHHQGWQRVGGFDLPRSALVVTATAGKQQARSLTLSNWKLSQ